MKKLIVTGISALALLLTLSNCGSSGSGNDGTTYNPSQCYTGAYTNNPTLQQQCIQSGLAGYYGPNGTNGAGYYYGSTGCGGYTCQVYTIPSSYSGYSGYSGYSQPQYYVVYPSDYYGYADNGQYLSGGGGVYISGSISW